MGVEFVTTAAKVLPVSCTSRLGAVHQQACLMTHMPLTVFHERSIAASNQNTCTDTGHVLISTQDMYMHSLTSS